MSRKWPFISVSLDGKLYRLLQIWSTDIPSKGGGCQCKMSFTEWTAFDYILDLLRCKFIVVSIC